ncbi:MAG: hypothetical protein Kow0063_24210 [Anaerolineae bacterium]
MQSVSLRDYCDQARSSIEAGEPYPAIRITRHILRHYPRHLEAYRLLGQALLLADNHQEAARQFRRVLSADPEDVSSRLGLAAIYQAAGDLDKAFQQLQRALDVAPDDSRLRTRLDQLVQLYPADDRPQIPNITRAALGRIHARAGLYDNAAQEFKAVLASSPNRADVQTALAEVLWRADQPLEAAEICHSLLEKLPYAIKANLILGALWSNKDQPDQAEPYLNVARELDPDNLFAQSFLGEASPLPPQVTTIQALGEPEEETRFEPPPTSPAQPVPVSQQPELATDWMSEPQEEESTPMSDEERADEEFELPDWLEGVGDDLLEDKDDQPAAFPSFEQEPGTEEETPAWLRELIARAEDSDASEEPTPAEPGEVPDWLQELRPEVAEELPSDSEVPDWLAATPQAQPPSEPEPAPVAAEPEPFEVPQPSPPESFDQELDLDFVEEAPQLEAATSTIEEWLYELPDLEETRPLAEKPPVEKTGLPAAPVPETPAMEETGLPDWLREIQAGGDLAEPEAEPAPEEAGQPSVIEPLHDVVEESDIPDWLREMTAGEPVPAEDIEPVAEPAPEAEIDQAGLPDWLRDFEEPAAPQLEFEATPPEPDLAPQPSATAEEGRALWEQILAEEGLDLEAFEEAPPPEAAGMTAEEWLRSTAELEGAPPHVEKPVPPAEAPALEELPAPPPSAAEAEPVEELPEWLGEYREPATVEEPPAWLAAEVEPEEEAPMVEIDEAGLPDWLREPAAESTEAPEPEAAPPAETPEWLAELETPDMFLAEPDLEEPIELETGEMPEWLGEIMAGEPAISEEWAPEPVQAETSEEQIPDWLREFREKQAGVTAEPTEAMAEVEAPLEVEEEEVLAEPAELPDWLLHLREGVPEAEPLPPYEEAGPAGYEEITLEPMAEAETVAEPYEPEAIQFEPEEITVAEEGPPELEWVEEEEEEVAAEVEEVLEPPQAEIAPEPEVPVPAQFVTRKLEALRAEELPKDPAARLAMARAAFNAGDWSDALMIYETLVNSSEMLDRVIDNLEVGVRRYPDDPAGYQLLGDACMKEGRLHAALEAYRKALSRL